MVSMFQAEQSEQTRALADAADAEETPDEGPELQASRRRGQRRHLWARAVGAAAALGAVILGALALAAHGSSPAPALRSSARPGALLGLAAGAKGDKGKACKKVYIDTDVGIDDNIALISAFGQHQLGTICIIGVGVTDGNIPAWISDYTFPRLLTLFGMEDLPFSTPTVDENRSGDIDLLMYDMDGNYQPPGGRGGAEHIHGKAGMGGMAEFLPSEPASDFPNMDTTGRPGLFLQERLEKECGDKECDILVLGPLTNVVAADKDVLAKRVRRVIWMGGSFVTPEELSDHDRQGIDYVPLHKGDWNVGLRRRGNIAPLSEFNAWAGSEPLAQFLTERDPTVGFDIIPLDVTSELTWSPHLVDLFESAAHVNDSGAWDSQEFRDQLMEFRSKHPGVTKENNEAIKELILNAFDSELKARRKSNFTYPSTPSGRASFIRDISVKGWASTVADGQIPRKAVGNLAHDVAVLVYELKGDLFDVGEVENVSVVVQGTATDKLWDKLDEDNFMEATFKNEQWGAGGAPVKGDLKGAVFEPSEADDAQVLKDLTKKNLTHDVEIKTGQARVVKFATFPGEPNKAETQVMDWLVGALAQAGK